MNQPINTQLKEMLEVIEGIKNTIELSGAEAYNFYRQAVIGTDEDKKLESKIEQLSNEMKEFHELVLKKLDELDNKSPIVSNGHLTTIHPEETIISVNDIDNMLKSSDILASIMKNKKPVIDKLNNKGDE